MLFGENFAGHIRTQNNQWVETRMISFIIPLQLPYSFFVIGVEHGRGKYWKRGLELKLVRQSVWALFLRGFIHITAFAAIALSLANMSDTPALIPVPLVALAAWIYICFIFGKTPSDEMLIREAMFRTTGYSIMPHWLKDADVTRFHHITAELYHRFVKDKTHTNLPLEEAYIALAFKVMERTKYNHQSFDAEILQLEQQIKPYFSFNKK